MFFSVFIVQDKRKNEGC